MSLNNAMTNKVARPHMLKSYKGMRSPDFDQHAYTDKEDWGGLRWVMKGVDKGQGQGQGQGQRQVSPVHSSRFSSVYT